MKKSLVTLVAIAALGLSVAGCSSYNRNTLDSAAIGGAVGAVAGCAAGSVVGACGQGAAIGAIGGAATGALVATVNDGPAPAPVKRAKK